MAPRSSRARRMRCGKKPCRARPPTSWISWAPEVVRLFRVLLSIRAARLMCLMCCTYGSGDGIDTFNVSTAASVVVSLRCVGMRVCLFVCVGALRAVFCCCRPGIFSAIQLYRLPLPAAKCSSMAIGTTNPALTTRLTRAVAWGLSCGAVAGYPRFQPTKPPDIRSNSSKCGSADLLEAFGVRRYDHIKDALPFLIPPVVLRSDLVPFS